MINNQQPIGIFDSGVGGLSILQSINQLIPHENLIYVADSEFVPYGNKTTLQIEERVLAIAKKLVALNVKAIVVACNTATAAAVTTLRGQYSIPIIGLEPALKPAIISSINKRIGMLATHATLTSQKYQVLKNKFAKDVKLVEKASPLFVNLVESSEKLGDKDYQLIEAELSEFKKEKIDSLVLGCTHYPFLKDAIQKILGENIKLFESGTPVAKEVKRRIESLKNKQLESGWIKFYASNPKTSRKQFERLLQKKIKIAQL